MHSNGHLPLTLPLTLPLVARCAHTLSSFWEKYEANMIEVVANFDTTVHK